MQESLRWWWLWAWACLVAGEAATDQGHCEVLDLSLQPSAYPLPTNLTIKPLSKGWHLHFNLQGKETSPAACVRLKESQSKVEVMLFKGDCVHGVIEDYNNLPGDSVPPQAWTNLAVNVKDSTVLVAAPNGDSMSLKAISWSLPRDALQVTMTQDVETAVGCHVNCPLYRHSTEGSDVKKKVGEWRHKKLHFYFRPGTTFNKVHYEAVCKTRHGSEFRRGVDIQPGKDGAKKAWHLVDLELQENTAKVLLNSEQLDDIPLLKSCITNMHVIWTVGDASFSFECDPKEMFRDSQRDSVIASTPGNSISPEAAAGIAVAVLLPIVFGLIIYILWSKRKTPKPSQRGEPQQTLVQFSVTNDSLDTSQQRDEVTLRSTRETSLSRSNTWSPGRSAARTSVWKVFGERTPSGRLIRPVMSQPPIAEERYSLAERDSLLEDEKWVTH